MQQLNGAWFEFTDHATRRALDMRREGLSAERDRAQRFAMKMTRKGRYGR